MWTETIKINIFGDYKNAGTFARPQGAVRAPEI